MSLCASFPFGFEGGMWELIILVLDHCLSFFFFIAWLCIYVRHPLNSEVLATVGN